VAFYSRGLHLWCGIFRKGSGILNKHLYLTKTIKRDEEIRETSAKLSWLPFRRATHCCYKILVRHEANYSLVGALHTRCGIPLQLYRLHLLETVFKWVCFTFARTFWSYSHGIWMLSYQGLFDFKQNIINPAWAEITRLLFRRWSTITTEMSQHQTSKLIPCLAKLESVSDSQ